MPDTLMLDVQKLSFSLTCDEDVKAVYRSEFPAEGRLPYLYLMLRSRKAGVEMLKFSREKVAAEKQGAGSAAVQAVVQGVEPAAVRDAARHAEPTVNDSTQPASLSTAQPANDSARSASDSARPASLSTAQPPQKEFVGLAYVNAQTIEGQAFVYILFLAVNPALHSQGLGSRILAQLEQLYPAHVMVLECEDPDQAAENSDQRRRRKRFYLRSGYVPLGIKTKEGKIVYEMLAKHGSCSREEYCKLVKTFCGGLPYLFLKPRFVD